MQIILKEVGRIRNIFVIFKIMSQKDNNIKMGEILNIKKKQLI